jgi:hypothetical protein
LTRITGIKRKRQLWLFEVFSVRTYEDLAALLPGDIVARLKAEGKPYSRAEVELWPQEAAELAEKKAQQSSRTTAELSATEVGNSPPRGSNPNPARGSNPKKAKTQRAQGELWKPVATFIVEFQTRRTKDQAIEQRTFVDYHDTEHNVDYPGIEIEQIGPWMVQMAGDKLHREIQRGPTAEPKTEGVKEEALPARIATTVTGLRLFQPAGTEISLASGQDGRPSTGTIRAGEPFTAEAEFEIGEQEAATIGRRKIPYQVQFYTENRSTRDRTHLGNAEPGLLTGGKASYSAMLGEITLPRGTYRLRVVVIVESENANLGYLELPMLRVV